ncbi:type I-B CRISPR-associated endonuclease Cas1 [Fusobacterium necrophorum]|uniref:CRISPR-associated endonuclease Cas1 n=1 Tax=Fusobacterium necrophorum DJ-2 TaxID=1441737 RepID=A0AB73C1K8_9FUSO|nr:type I-B CRISPR-associated endonuclease Cas1b [Fusobacterium necrophorum]AYZ74734.1 type I-B CRISPR-associated endonuclease Cas1 [Fusobacterium necrophorum]AZW08871.1 type I-B CRISPR-associated endonuclease Cas1 [Fusobacterium necrophorum subsp. necrophorum]KDE61695.1 CRISPR-associated protein Cas1 [Fusobacterium necrophorum BFTR-1]KDE66248.1 CRISPR-associated protein Cas1 [Fusobacterium necrophorum DJ-1]KDE71055.1 CRISPR-associated protein Cas1 [Fusobacterium necrophorum DJ-2]
MKRSYFLYSNGTLKRKDNTITFINEKEEKKDIPIEMIDDFYIMSEMNFNTKFINYISQFGIPIHFFNYYTFYTGSFYPRETMVSGQLLVKQVEHYLNEEKRIEIAREFIEGASFNIYRNLRYYNGRGKDVSTYMHQIEELRKQLPNVTKVDELMGYEGNIRKIYYEAWNIIINQDIQFEKRVKNPPDNMINSLISFVNTLFYTKVLGEIYKTQLNSTISYLHQPSTKRFSLSLDISEIFKPLIVDRLIFSLLNKKQITEKSFVKDFEYLRLKEDASKLIVQELEERLKQVIQHKDLNRKVSYQYLIRLECYKLIKHLLGEKKYLSFQMWW